MISYSAALTSAHEACHVAAALAVGRKVEAVYRERHELGGLTVTVRPPGQDPVLAAEDLIVVLLAPVFEVGPRGAEQDVMTAKFLGGFPNVNLDAASDRARRLVQMPHFRSVRQTVEFALHEHPTMSGEEIDLLLALERNRP